MSFFSSIKKSIFQPTRFYEELSDTEPNILKALLTLLISSVILVGTIFLGELLFGGDLIFNEFDLQTETFIIQQLSTLQLCGYYIGSNQYLLLFFDKVFFLIKMWLIFIGVVYVSAFIFRKEKAVNITKSFEVMAWSSNVFLILSGITVLFLGIRFITPLYYHYIYYGIFIAFLVVIFPAYFINGLGKATRISLYKRMIFVFSPMVLFFVLWLVNHSDILLSHML